MYLKRLESVGFKSFAERISVDFVPGVTSVVGPNGSGKSNITDAIRWVLGEQSARSLRGSKMEDVIFQGSDTRRALNVAEVTLVLENSDKELPIDYDEVSVTRRVYRSGESEFYINKQSCRLKDIVDLFMDSGLGREAFSIISQGKVEEILSSKADERRTIFEEAAGVLKYKQRKKKSEYKLAETQENLNRVEDIIHEIEQQIEPLEEQAETARNYLDKKEQLKQHEISLLITEIEQLHEKWQALLDELDKEKTDELNQKTAIQTKEAELEHERQELQKLDDEIEQLQANLLSTTEQLEQYEGKKQVFNERTKHFTENKEKLEAQKKETAERIEMLQYELNEENAKLSSLQSSRNETKDQVKQLETKLTTESENIAEQIEELKSDYIEYLNEQAAKRNEKQSVQQQLQQIAGKKEKQAAKFEDLLQEREELSTRTEKLKSDYAEQEETCQSKSQAVQQLKDDLTSKRNAFQEAQTKLYQGYQYIEKLKSKKEMLEDMKEDFQGFFHGVKAILKAREEKKLDGIHGAVIELIDVPKKYITAIETVLGPQAQHVVVNDDQAARQAISWLKKTNSGRSTFLPLRSIQARFVPKGLLAKAESHPGFVGVAGDLVSAPPEFQKAVNHLMGHNLVAETLQDANEIASLINRKHRVVTLEGDVVNPGGSMSGGAQKKSKQSLFTREKDLQEVTEKLTNFQQKADAFEQQVDNEKQQISELEEKLAEEENQVSEEQEKLQTIHSSFKETEMKLASLNDNLALYDQDKQQFNQDTNELNERDEQLTKALETISEQLESTQQEIDKLSEQEETFRENQEQLKEDYQSAQVALAEQEERLKNQREKTNNVQTQLNDYEEQYEIYANDLNELLDVQNSEETEEDIEATISEAKANKDTITAKTQEMRSNRSERTQILQDQDRELKEENKQHQAVKEAIQEKEVRANRLDVELENRLSKLQTEYTMTFEKAKQDYDKTDNVQETQSMVEQIKQAIDQLGTVNLGAIDEYERISERYEFLSEQRNDLVEAKQTLHSVIAEMDEEMEKRFGDTFDQIKKEFSVVFKQLFGGGKAELKLTDPKNLLDTGVEIIAQPPGKKLQHLGLLSGGERALTAIALLFAILRVRPVPFCVLDEVEAALDEANVVRFATYLKTYSEDTQFIVITHRKGTMEESDVLYGVTMQESGVSRLVSVRLEDTEELINA
ncbi:chromosome segregation protein SMC [Lentibacillus sp. CBA3610]|uniref:chromosome segregation protein SMC n=1 Tax=Lentibacillus sp. CBA3610 TaxID=2518176 RepID=UPI0015951FC3|nr:chromosome segregation protein SMC [Lentibacillus sp. CBA3610]QKY69006.1 chromosome segregation protein SMC [Lentibacillus sp. CBA3610]